MENGRENGDRKIWTRNIKLYMINKRRRIELKKATFNKFKEEHIDFIEQEEYELKILDEAVKKLKSGKAVFYTHEEFWNKVKEGMKKEYETISHNIRGKYA